LMNTAFAFALATAIYFLGLPVRINPAIVGGVRPGSPEADSGIRAGDRIVAVNGRPVSSWEDVQMTVAMAPTNVVPVTVQRNGKRTVHWLPARQNPQLGVKLLDLEQSGHPIIKKLVRGGPAESAGLKPGDEIRAFNGLPVLGQEQLVGLIQKQAGKKSDIQIKRDGATLSVPITPKRDPKTGLGMVGVMLGSTDVTVYQIEKPGPPPWELVGRVTQRTFQTIGALLHPRETGIGVKDLSGPPGILAMLAVEVKTDYRLALEFMVLLNVSLAMLNLLPLPVLDGGHIALAVVERVRGRPLSPQVQEYTTMIFASLLLSFMLYVSYNDISRRFSLFKSMFDERVQIQPANHSPDNRVPAQ
ncbi:MAG TPA: PDZ domain-containing protein, partial [Verrucomicrobiae bacterium]|nr:PDZ domain-containing protein [Verrucomicrobiae bacterium]